MFKVTPQQRKAYLHGAVSAAIAMFLPPVASSPHQEPGRGERFFKPRGRNYAPNGKRECARRMRRMAG